MVRTISKTAKSIIAVIIAFAIFLTIDFVKIDAAASGFYVSGTTVYDANGNAFVMRGVNIAHAWYTGYTETSIKAAASLGANTVRVVLSDGQEYTKTSSSEVQQIIDWCKQYKVVCVLEVHDATGSDSTSDLNNAVNYWIEMKDILNANRDYVIVNIANEWYGTWDGSGWANGYKSAISTLRNAGIKNLLMIDCAGWGQYPASVHNYGTEVFNSDSERNLMFSIHMYEYAGGDSSTVKSNIDNALNTGVPLVIGEFGGYHTNGDVDEETIMSYCQSKGVGYLGWSWKGNNSSLSYLDIANNWDGSSLTTWGNTLFYHSSGIKNTSSTCSIYTGSSSSGGSSDSGSSSGGSSDSGSSSGSSGYVSLFYGSASASGWDQAVSVSTTRAGGSFDASNITSGGHFYVEYKGTQDQVELVLQSWSGGSSWGKVSISESGTANGNYYAKFSYDNCVSTFGSSDFAGKLDRVHVGATGSNIEVVSVCYDFGNGSSSDSSSSSGSSDSGSSSGGSSNNVYTDSNGGVIGLDGVYYIKNVYSGRYLDVANGSSANGTNVQQYQYNGSNAQKFKLVGDGNGYYSILTAASGYNSGLDVYNWSSSNGANINQWEYHGGDCQKFQIVSYNGAYIIKTKISNCYSCLDVYGWSSSNGGNIAQWEFLGGNNQLWYLEAAN